MNDSNSIRTRKALICGISGQDGAYLAKLLLGKGYEYEEAYSSVPFQNANLSVRVTDDFMEAVRSESQHL